MGMAFRKTVVGCFCVVSFIVGFSLSAEEIGGTNNPCQVETSAFMVMNAMPDPGDFYQLSLGYRLDEKNILYINGITWKYAAPLGIPWGPSKESPDEEYPGYVRAFGLGLGYQRFLWNGLFASLSATPFLQKFYTSDDDFINSGFQLFLMGQVGYQIDLFKGRVYLKPAVSFNYWPVNTNFPENFQQKENNWPNYFCFEPFLNIGIRF